MHLKMEGGIAKVQCINTGSVPNGPERIKNPWKVLLMKTTTNAIIPAKIMGFYTSI